MTEVHAYAMRLHTVCRRKQQYTATPINVPELAARLTTLNDLVGADEASPGLSVGAEGRERGDDDEEGGGDGEEEGSNRGSKRKRGASST